MKHSFGKIVLAMAALTASLVIAGCGGNGTAGSSGQAAASSQSSDVIRVATNCTMPPFQSIDASTGKPVGIDIDIAEYIGKKMNKKIEIQDMKFKALIPSLAGGRSDMVVAGLSPTDERAKVVSFTKPYFYPPKAILSKKGSGLDSLESLKGHKAGTTLGTNYVDDLKSVEGVEVVELDSAALCVEDLLNGQLDAVELNGSLGVVFAQKHPELEVHMLALATDKNNTFTIALPKDSPDVETVNQIIDEMKANGEFEKILTKHMGAEQAQNYIKMVKDLNLW